MTEREISTPQDLDAALAASAMQKHEKRWRVAEGRSFRWTELFAAIIGGLLVLSGLYGTVVEQEIAGAVRWRSRPRGEESWLPQRA